MSGYKIKYLTFLLPLLFVISCAYYNIMFNAKEKYESGEKRIKQSAGKEITPEMRKDFYDAIDKCWKLLNIYGDSSAYATDALLLIGKSHWQVEEYVKSERHLRQFINRYPKTDLITEANLWLGKSLEKLDRDDEAIQYLNMALQADEDDEINAQVYLSLGSVYYKKEIYERARTQLNQAIDASDDDNLKAGAQFLIAETYFDERDYEQSAVNFEKVKEYSTQIDFLFKSFMRKIDCYVEMDQDELAIQLLEENSSDNRFLKKKSILRARIGDLYKDQGKFIEATEEYDNVLTIYPKTEGSAMAAYGMAQLMEFAYSALDSARVLYQRVGKEYRKSELTEEADRKSRILDQYQKINTNIKRDMDDLRMLEKAIADGDSIATAEEDNQEEQEVQSTGSSKKKKPVTKKPAARTLVEINKSLEKNQFSKAEFFLLSLADYDSAIAVYSTFIQVSEDSILVPKAHYALYYIYGYELNNSAKADSIKDIILYEYPSSIYAKYFKGQDESEMVDKDDESPYKYLYIQGESLISDGQYFDAIDIFTQIAVEDSGSKIAQKARYSNAWIYEKKLEDIPNAVHAYTLVAEEYPNTEMGKIAKAKIKVPVEEKPALELGTPDSLGRSSANEEIFIPGESDSTKTEDDTQAWPTLEEVEQNNQTKEPDPNNSEN